MAVRKRSYGLKEVMLSETDDDEQSRAEQQRQSECEK